VSAEVRYERDGVKANDSFTVRLHYPKLIVTLAANCLSAQPRPRYVVRGTEGGFVKWGLDPQEARLKDNPMTAGHGEEPESAWGKLAFMVDGELVTEIVPSIPGDYRLYYAGVRDAILGKGPVPVKATDALKVAQMLEWAEESSASGRTIPCNWTSQ
jgi:predicted dehydrogenase